MPDYIAADKKVNGEYVTLVRHEWQVLGDTPVSLVPCKEWVVINTDHGVPLVLVAIEKYWGGENGTGVRAVPVLRSELTVFEEDK